MDINTVAKILIVSVIAALLIASMFVSLMDEINEQKEGKKWL